MHYYTPIFKGYKKEIFKTILLDSRSKFIKDVTIYEGSLNSSIVHPREVFRPVIKESAASVLLLHNHPSGDSSPSQDDIEITKRLKKTSEIIGIDMLDHIIIGDGKYYSFLDERLL